MTRSEFLGAPHVQPFITFFASHFDAPPDWQHSYTVRRTGGRWTCSSLVDACRQYEWNGKPWLDNLEQLLTFRRRLRGAVARNDSEMAFDVCAEVLRWGGVWANNGKTLTARRAALLKELAHVSALLASDRTPDAHSMMLDGANCSMNAGFVKIYSVLLDWCVIYDGRVGAALGLIVRQYCEGLQLGEVPPPLRFAYGAPKEDRNAKAPKSRNPTAGPYRFPKLRQDARMHTEQTMRANWLLTAGLQQHADVFSPGEAGFHELAAGLFMVGYDLTEAPYLAPEAV